MSEQPLSLAQRFHERTKYAPQTIAANSQRLDWDKQPNPFKDYKLGTSIALRPYLTNNPEAFANDPAELWWQRLSRLLYGSYGLTAEVQTFMGEPFYMRSTPSAGGLYPAELYVISRGTPELSPGLYNYQPKPHALLRFWDSDVWAALQAACFNHPALADTDLALITTAVFFRSAWRYHDRAYRRICLDTGHLLGNIELACAINQFRPHLIAGFADAAVNQLLYLEPDQEGVITILPLVDLVNRTDQQAAQPAPVPHRTVLKSLCQTDGSELPDGELLGALHKATQIAPDAVPEPWDTPFPHSGQLDKYNFPFWGGNLEDLEKTIIRRRSTRAYSGAALALDELLALLDFTYQPQHYQSQGLDANPDYCDLNWVQTFIAVTAVTGLEEGCYYYAPAAQELRQIRFKNFRRDLHYLCLGQELGRDAAAVVFHTADLAKAVAQYGDRAYRYLHLDAGHLGQRLNLAAIRLSLGVSGIGGFFDDQVNEVLGIPADEAVLYITTLGRPQ
jgi:SagB-type dehydrogenase family enzyme